MLPEERKIMGSGGKEKVTQEEKENFFSIDWSLIPMKAHYFLYSFGLTPFFWGAPIIARQKGFSSSAVGLLLTVLNLLGVLSRPFFGWLSDRFKIHKLVLLLMIALTGLSVFLINFIPSFASEVKLLNVNGSEEVVFCPKDPVWDNCLEERLKNFENNFLKCHLICEVKSNLLDSQCIEGVCSQRLDTIEREILLDITTITKNSSCIVIKEYKNRSILYAQDYEYDETLNCEAHCDDEFFKGTLANRGTLPDEEIIQKREFWLFCFLFLIESSAKSIVISLGNTICFEALGDRSHLFGRQLMWDSIAGGFSLFSIGTIIDLISGDNVFKNYSPAYITCLVALVLNMFFVMKLDYVPPKKSKNIVKDVGKIFKSFKIVTYFGWCIFAGVFTAGIWNFLFWHLEEIGDSIGQEQCGKNHNKIIQGIDVSIQAFFGDLPFMFLSGYFLKKFGHMICMHIAFLGFMIRFLYYSVLSNPWYVFPVEFLNGISWGLMIATMSSYANVVGLPGTEATMQSLVGALFEGVGVSAGCYILGNLFSDYGGHTAFLVLGIIVAIVIIVHAGINHFCLKKKV